MKFDIVEFLEKLLKHFNFHLDGTIFTATLLQGLHAFLCVFGM
jgi:hypothetical protein